MPKVKANGNHHQLRAARGGRAACPHSLSRRRLCLLRLSGRGLCQAFHLHLPRPARSGRDRQAGRHLFDGIVRRRRRRLHAGDRRRARACKRPVARRGDGTMAGRQIPERVKSLSLHSCWPKTDPFLKVVVEGWRSIAKGLDSVQEMVIQGIFPCASRRSFMRPNRTISTSSRLSCAAGRSSRLMPSCANRSGDRP